MNRYLDRLRQEHRRLNRLTDICRSLARQSGMMSLKRLRLEIKGWLAQLKRSAGPVTP